MTLMTRPTNMRGFDYMFGNVSTYLVHYHSQDLESWLFTVALIARLCRPQKPDSSTELFHHVTESLMELRKKAVRMLTGLFLQKKKAIVAG